MITGAIAVVFAIAAFVCAANGEWGPFAVAVVIAVLMLALGGAGRKQDRAYNNFVDYWANGDRTRRKNPDAERMKRLERDQKRWREEAKKPPDRTLVGGLKTAGDLLQPQGTTHICPMCSAIADEFNRVRYSSGTIYVNYRCRECGRTWPVKVK